MKWKKSQKPSQNKEEAPSMNSMNPDDLRGESTEEFEQRTMYDQGTSQIPRGKAKKATGRRDHKRNSNILEEFIYMLMPKSGVDLHTNRHIIFSMVLVLVLFVWMIGYLVHFIAYDSAAIITDSHNNRSDILSSQTIRGNIYSADGALLAETTTDEDGVEKRDYPFGRVFAHIVGYASHGKAGLESACNVGLLTSHTDILKQMLNSFSGKKSQGDSVYSTLDSRLQKTAYDTLGDYRGAIVAIEPSTGKVLAMVSKPDFNPNEIDAIWSDLVNDPSNSSLLNRATNGMYPPGSTYKILTALEYMEENPTKYEKFSYNCEGETIVDSVHIKCYKNAEHGKENLDEAFTHSCNTAFVTIGSKLNLKKFVALNKKFLFGESIPFDIAVKKSYFGLNNKSERSDMPQAVIGQGETLMTPFHNALIMCAVANDGVLMKPYMIDHYQNEDGKTFSQAEPEEYQTLVAKEDAKKLQKLLREVVTDGTGSAVKTDRYTAAGKTGTAENSGEKSHSWFVGYSNIENPDLVVCVLVENSGAGSQYAAPMAREIFDAYYDIKEKE